MPSARALALDPDDDTANFWAANELSSMDRTVEAESLLDHILLRAPENAYRPADHCRGGANRGAIDEQLVRLPTDDGMGLVFRNSSEEPLAVPSKWRRPFGGIRRSSCGSACIATQSAK